MNHSNFSSFYNQSLTLLTDLYQLTMVYGYWKAGIADRQAVFHLNFRRWPFKGGFAVAAGLETAIHFFNNFKFSKSDLDYLGSLQDVEGGLLFEKDFLHFLSTFQFECDIDAVPEGTIIFPYEPLIRVKGPIWQAQLLESPMLNLINFQTLIATKAARICMAAHPDPVIEFGMRRAQGADGAISASRAAYIGGCAGTSDVIAGKLFGIPVRGTHAHSWVMAFDEEQTAFKTFANIMPKGCVMLIDTYNSIEGAKRAIEVGREMRKKGSDLYGVRLDSGDLAYLSIEIRKLLDQEGFSKTEIMASNELDEYLIRDLKQQGAQISMWGVGTNLVTAKDQPALDGVYKLSAIQNEKGEWVSRIKLSEQTAKTTNPGILQIRRFFDETGYVGDGVFDQRIHKDVDFSIVNFQDSNDQRSFGHLQYEDLLIPVFSRGKLVYHAPSLPDIRRRASEGLKRFSPSIKRLINPQPYFTGLENELYHEKLTLIRNLKGDS